MRRTIPLLLVLVLAGCGGGGGATSGGVDGTDDTEDTGDTETTRTDVSVDGIGTVTTVAYVEPIDLRIRSINGTVTVESADVALNVSGLNNLITLSPGTVITSCDFGGSDNTLAYPADGTVPACTAGGLGNQIISY